MKKFLVLCILVVSFAGCAIQPSTPAQSVYALQSGYVGALTLAVKYKALPICGLPTSPALCSDAVILQNLQKADDVAYIALQAAQTAVRNPGVTALETTIKNAQIAIEAFTSVATALQLK